MPQTVEQVVEQALVDAAEGQRNPPDKAWMAAEARKIIDRLRGKVLLPYIKAEAEKSIKGYKS